MWRRWHFQTCSKVPVHADQTQQWWKCHVWRSCCSVLDWTQPWKATVWPPHPVTCSYRHSWFFSFLLPSPFYISILLPSSMGLHGCMVCPWDWSPSRFPLLSHPSSTCSLQQEPNPRLLRVPEVRHTRAISDRTSNDYYVNICNPLFSMLTYIIIYIVQ